MKLINVAVRDIIWNPWRDETIAPIDPEHVSHLVTSIGEHGFFSSAKGRKVNAKYELGCAHARLEAAKKARLDTIPVFIADLDDDEMLRLMTDENALQPGANPGHVLNEVAAITKRILEGLLGEDLVPSAVAVAFPDRESIKHAQHKLRGSGGNVHILINATVIRCYMGRGKLSGAHRTETQVREAISTLRQSGKYDDIIEEALDKFATLPPDTPASTSKAVATRKTIERRPRILDERTAAVFPDNHQFIAFREAVTTEAAKKAIPVSAQLALAKDIMSPAHRQDFKSKQVGAPFIKARVQHVVQERLKEQRNIDAKEREAMLAEQREERIGDVLYTAKASMRSLLSSVMKLCELADEFPAHPRIAGFAETIKPLGKAIEQLQDKLKPGKR